MKFKNLSLVKSVMLNAVVAGGVFFTSPVVSNICLAQDAVAENNATSAKVYEDFVNQTGNEIINILVNKDAPMESRKADFRKVLSSKFDMQAIGRFVMARYWRVFDQSQKNTYLSLFENAVVENYAAQFDNYHNEKLEVKGSYETPDKGLVVQSTIIRPAGGPPLKVDWKVFQTKGGLKVLDIIVDGVSMSITLRSEYMGVFQSKGGATGGGIDGLFTYLKEKIANPKKDDENAS